MCFFAIGANKDEVTPGIDQPTQLTATLGEETAKARRDLLGFPVDSNAGDPGHLDSGQLQVLLAFPVGLERRWCPVVIVGVEFDREALGGLVGVQLVTLDEEVRGRWRQAGAPDQREEVSLQARARKSGRAMDLQRCA